MYTQDRQQTSLSPSVSNGTVSVPRTSARHCYCNVLWPFIKHKISEPCCGLCTAPRRLIRHMAPMRTNWTCKFQGVTLDLQPWLQCPYRLQQEISLWLVVRVRHLNRIFLLVSEHVTVFFKNICVSNILKLVKSCSVPCLFYYSKLCILGFTLTVSGESSCCGFS
jgi:hypothetical protein